MTTPTSPAPDYRTQLEQSLVSIVLWSGADWERAARSIGPEDIADPRLRVIFEVVGQLVARGSTDLDPATVALELDRLHRLEDAGGSRFVGEVATSNPDPRRLDQRCTELRAEIARERLAEQAKTLAGRLGDRAAGLPGAIDTLDAMRSAVESAAQPAGSRLPVTALAEIMTTTPDPMAWLIPNLLPKQGVVVLGGKQKQGKTLLAQQLALCVAGFREVLGREVATPGPVVFVGLEGSRNSFLERIQKQVGALEIAPDAPFHLVTRPKRELLTIGSDLWRDLEALCAAINPVLVVIDPLAWISNSPESDNDEMARKVMLPLQQFAVRHDTLVLVIHHLSKPTGDAKHQAPDPGEFVGIIADKFRGATAITAGTDGNLVLELLKDAQTLRLYGEFRDAPTQALYLRRDPTTLVYEPTSIPSEQVKESFQTQKTGIPQLLSWLVANQPADSAEGVMIQPIAAGLGIAWGTTKRLLDEAGQAGQVARSKVGSRYCYRVAPGVSLPSPSPASVSSPMTRMDRPLFDDDEREELFG
jgi:hypothetical protein